MAQLQHLDGVLVAAIGFDLKPEQAEAEDREVETGEQRRLDDAGEDAEPGAGGAERSHASRPFPVLRGHLLGWPVTPIYDGLCSKALLQSAVRRRYSAALCRGLILPPVGRQRRLLCYSRTPRGRKAR